MMNGCKRGLLCLLAAALMLLLTSVVSAKAVFEIETPASCGAGDTIEVKVRLQAEEALQDSDVFLVYDKSCFEFADAEDGEHDASAGTVRFRGDFSANSFGQEWTATFKAIKSGSAVFSISDKWVQDTKKNVVDASAEEVTVKITANTGGNTQTNETGTEGTDGTDMYIRANVSMTLHLTEPKEVPSCFIETTANINGTSCKAWTLHEKMQEETDYGASLADYYALYGYTEKAEDAVWYLYDEKEGTFQRLLMLDNVKVKQTAAEDAQPQEDAAEEDSEGATLFEKLTGLMIGVFVILVIVIIVFNVVYSRMEKKSREKFMEERRKESRDALMKKRADERNAAMRQRHEEKPEKNESQNMQRPD